MKIKIKLIITICLLIFMLGGCQSSLASLEPAEKPQYPQIDGESGYSVEGYAKDKNGNALQGVQLEIEDKVYAITDENGYYKIYGIEGEKEIRPVFYDYEFESGEFTVSGKTTQDLSGTNAKTYMVTFDSYASHNQSVEIFGVSYQINGKSYSGDDDQKAFLEKLSGKTTITPQKEGFTFIPESMDVYSQTNAKFTAVPNGERYSVSGSIDISSFDSEDYIQTVEMYVDGKLATDSYIEYSYESDGTQLREMKYRIDGLDKTTSSHAISYKINGTESIQKINVTQATTDADFKYYITKEVDIKLDISDLDSDWIELPSEYFIDYDIYVYDEDDTLVKRYSGKDITREGVVIWRGAKIEVTGLFRAPDEVLDDGTVVVSDMKSISKTVTVSESDMRADYYEGEYFEIRTSLRTYRPDDDD